ncbi:hypothetical protein FZC84_08205 [Rossellomorea vietnamensis]|uniref:Uncharacterized protein n=1 Tax=Rossellomorea vietnamensis TaxID=218284 RepID=A0A5D4MDP4_9BACI|nr:hypothetical protein [Rossellomorea vietnamensis]TYR99792.1 hypothetical protein FZC84_08205 [Rossellomorea vietnamensis]
MNEHLMEILARDIVAGLPPYKREVYEYVVRAEDELASQSETSDQFMSLLVKHSPHKQAAARFNMTYGQLIVLMREIESEIDEKLKEKEAKIKWIDYSDNFKGNSGASTNRSLQFMFMI